MKFRFWFSVLFGIDILINSVLGSDVSSSFQSAGIVPDIINTAPKDLLSVMYNCQDIKFNEELTPTQVKDVPIVYWDPDNTTFYTIVMTEPDPKSPNKSDTQVLHWLVTNICTTSLSKRDVLAEYVGSGPPKDTGLYQYVFLLFKQLGYINFEAENRISKNSSNGRLNFSIQKFADKYHLGAPIAGNMYQAQYDDYVPQLHAQFTE